MIISETKLTPREEQIIELLKEEPRTTDDLVRLLITSKKTIHVLICKLRKKGFDIRSPRLNRPFDKRKDVPQLYTFYK